jgi:hypothetical protein
MVTSPYKWNILEWDVKQYIINQSIKYVLCMSACPYTIIYLYVYLSIFLYACPSICLCACLSICLWHPSICVPARQSLCLPVYLYVYSYLSVFFLRSDSDLCQYFIASDYEIYHCNLIFSFPYKWWGYYSFHLHVISSFSAWSWAFIFYIPETKSFDSIVPNQNLRIAIGKFKDRWYNEKYMLGSHIMFPKGSEAFLIMCKGTSIRIYNKQTQCMETQEKLRRYSFKISPWKQKEI